MKLAEQYPVSIYNSKSKGKEEFKAIHPEKVGMYVCGPTVYGDPHLGHARSAITFDIVFRYLSYLGSKVRYVRNVTDVGHLENDADEGEDKIAKKARIDQVEPMEVVQHYTVRYRECMYAMGCLPPSIEPTASGHIIEQIELIEAILKNGYAYEVNGSVYFDVRKFAETGKYGILSGKVLEDMLEGSRNLDGQDEKRSAVDFALWKKANPEHIMRWPSPWSDGFPGWHLECTAMSSKYLGVPFDIHGGGMDLQFPHHEGEIAQCIGAHGEEPVNYWMHNNMLTINGQKMGKSLGNFITLQEMFAGDHKLLDKPYHPMIIRFFMLMANYKSTLDFSNEALQAAEKGLNRLFKAKKTVEKLATEAVNTLEFDSKEITEIVKTFHEHMSDDFNTPRAIASLFDLTKLINSSVNSFCKNDLNAVAGFLSKALEEVLGLAAIEDGQNTVLDQVMQLILDIRKGAKQDKNFVLADQIRDELAKSGIKILDSKEGSNWEI